MQQGWSNDGKQCGNPWSGLENERKEVVSQRKSEKKEVQSDILAHEAEQGLPKELPEGGGKNMESTCS